MKKKLLKIITFGMVILLCFTNLFGCFLFQKQETPNEIDSDTVVVLGDDSLIKNKDNITEIIIPASVERIEAGVFQDMPNLTKVTIAQGSNLVSIGEFAFSNCANLTEINLPNTLISIGDYAFYNCALLSSVNIPIAVQSIGAGAFMGCNSITSVNIPSTTSSIGDFAFLNCASLSAITVNSSNIEYSSVNGVLMSGNKILCYPQGKTESSYIVPTYIETIGHSAFYGNSYLTNVNLSNTRVLENYAFYDCSNLATIVGANVDYVYTGALYGTTQINSFSGDRFVLGDALVKYVGTATSLDLTNYVSISDYAFFENTTLQNVTIGGNNVNIGSFTFEGCTSLSRVDITNVNEIIFKGLCTFDNVNSNFEIYVADRMIEDYVDNEFWSIHEDDFKAYETIVNFETNGGTVCNSTTFKYLNEIGNLPTPTKLDYMFNGWYTDSAFSGSPLNSSDLWDSTATTVTLYANWVLIRNNMCVTSDTYIQYGGSVGQT